jgi:transposase
MTMTNVRPAYNTTPTYTHIVAFDVSKETLDVHVIPDHRASKIANKPKTIRKFLIRESHLNASRGLGPLLVVCEATGGYERAVLAICTELGLDCHLAHGGRVRHFGNYFASLAKTDPIDARLIAEYGLRTPDLRLYSPPSAEQDELKEMKARRDQIQEMLIGEGNRLEHARCASVMRSVKASIAILDRNLKACERQLAAFVAASKTLLRKAQLLRSVRGVGPMTAITLLASMPELGTLSKGQAAALVGLAPYNNDSGKKRGRRAIDAGRATVRKTLYMAALTALRTNPLIKAFGAKLKARGKPFKVVAAAAMRKLIVILNAILRTGEPCKAAKQA